MRLGGKSALRAIRDSQDAWLLNSLYVSWLGIEPDPNLLDDRVTPPPDLNIG
jgi:hypothetical protein